jgi:hypothetical protein
MDARVNPRNGRYAVRRENADVDKQPSDSTQNEQCQCAALERDRKVNAVNSVVHHPFRCSSLRSRWRRGRCELSTYNLDCDKDQ